MATLTGVVDGSGKYLVTASPVDTKTHSVLKITFENNTAGTNLNLFAGTTANFVSGSGGLFLASSGGPGFQFLVIVDTHVLSGNVIFVIRDVGSADSKFTLTVE